MPSTRLALSLTVLALAAAAPVNAGEMTAPMPAALAPLAALAGSWQGKTSDGKTTHATYEVDGNVVVEKLQTENEVPMITVYHADGDHLMMTHYCSIGNQPRMRAAAGKGELDFTFVDGTNMKSADDAHMSSLRVRFTDSAHFQQVWTMRMNGKDMPVTFDFTRIAAK